MKEFLDSWRSDDEIVCILNGKYGIETTKEEQYSSFAKKYDKIDLEDGFEYMFCHCYYVRNVNIIMIISSSMTGRRPSIILMIESAVADRILG